jgi:hypothetical protein
VKGYGKYGRKYGKDMKNTEENSEKIGKIQKKTVKRYGKYGRKEGKDMKNPEENSEKIGKILKKL